jgi:hypothetical protein
MKQVTAPTMRTRPSISSWRSMPRQSGRDLGGSFAKKRRIKRHDTPPTGRLM